MNFVINKVALPSDLHPPPEVRMTVRNEYVSAYAKMDVHVPVKDKVKYYVSPTDYIMFYLNYDKVKRICTFCGLMFHNVQFCPERRRLILHLQSINASTAAVPFSYIGLWTSQARKIPQVALDQSNVLGGLSTEFRNYMKIDRPTESKHLSLSQFIVTAQDTRNIQMEERVNAQPRDLIAQQATPQPYSHIQRHQYSESNFSQQRLNRQAASQPNQLVEQEEKDDEGFLRSRSVPPFLPQYSVSRLDDNACQRSSQDPQHQHHFPSNHVDKSHRLSYSERKFFYPSKRKRWDDDNSHVTQAIQQAKQIAANFWSASSPCANANAAISMPPQVQKVHNPEQYNTIHKIIASMWMELAMKE